MSARKFALLVVLMASLSFGAATAIGSGAVGIDDVVRYVNRELWDPACQIKGNVSVSTGERIFHSPGQLDYSATRIDYLKGERWFCTEADAMAASWRQAGR
ncbi:MAG: hypothetical protein DI604_20445 [Delftia acidovorans]|nr:MAG: hypothetical protein DI604_20445 [Delftia acidovorans]